MCVGFWDAFGFEGEAVGVKVQEVRFEVKGVFRLLG